MNNATDYRQPKVDSVTPDTFPNPAGDAVSYSIRVIGSGFETTSGVLASPVEVTAGGGGVSISEVSVYSSERIDCTLTISPGHLPGSKSVTVSQTYVERGGDDTSEEYSEAETEAQADAITNVTLDDTLHNAFSVV